MIHDYQSVFYSIYYIFIICLTTWIGYQSGGSEGFVLMMQNTLIPLILTQSLRPGRLTAIPVLALTLILLTATFFASGEQQPFDYLDLFLFFWSITASLTLQVIGFFMVTRFARLKSIMDTDRKELMLARTVHESLFPSFQGNDRIQFYTYRSPENELGGDFYDLVFLREGNIGLFLSDISGHGMSAAMLSAAMKVILNKLPYRCRIDPEEMLTRFDQIITESYRNHHATAVYVLFDFITRRAIFANAGHPPVLFSRGGEPFREIHTTGSLLGYGFRIPAADAVSLEIKKGDRILLYTDGLVEFDSVSGYVETIEISEVLENIESVPGDEAIHTMIQRIRQMPGFLKFRDDVLIVMAEIQ